MQEVIIDTSVGVPGVEECAPDSARDAGGGDFEVESSLMIPSVTQHHWDHNGPSEWRWHLVFLPDGFLLNELDEYRDRVNLVLTRLLSEAPFNEDMFRYRMNFTRLDVASAISGINDAREQGWEDRQATTFGVTKGRWGMVFPVWDNRRVVSVLGKVPGWNAAVIIAKDEEKLGVRSNNVAVISTGSSVDVALHEIGHMMGLTDEYESCSNPLEPPRSFFRKRLLFPEPPNVAHVEYGDDDGDIPWRAVLPDPFLVYRKEPASNIDRRMDADLFPDFSDTTIGLFEGTKSARSRSWRAQFNCKMRFEEGRPFCIACRAGIRVYLYNHTRIARP